MPKVIMEAMIYGIPVVSTRVGSLPRIFQDKVHCSFVDPGNVKQMTDAIQYIIQNPKYAASISENAYKVCLNYDLSTTSENIARMIHNGYSQGG
jgi:glycosyltransferase involved in cell wall biosynthesis